jgi:hypothetical protein
MGSRVDQALHTIGRVARASRILAQVNQIGIWTGRALHAALVNRPFSSLITARLVAARN